jgi:hypothetical protein
MMACRRSSLTIRKKFVSNNWQLKTVQNHMSEYPTLLANYDARAGLTRSPRGNQQWVHRLDQECRKIPGKVFDLEALTRESRDESLYCLQQTGLPVPG